MLHEIDVEGWHVPNDRVYPDSQAVHTDPLHYKHGDRHFATQIVLTGLTEVF